MSIKKIETIDVSKLQIIVANLRPVLIENNITITDVDRFGKDPLNGFETILRKYLNKAKDGVVKVTYKQKGNNGRYFADKSLSLQCIKREIRQTICHEYYDDIDVVNAHPVILLYLCKKIKLKVPFLTTYIESRDKTLEDTGLDRDQAKKLYLIMINASDIDIKCSNDHMRGFKSEMKNIHNTFYKLNKIQADAFIMKRRKSGKSQNMKAAYLNSLMCEMENKILMAVMEFYGNPEDCVLCFDGIMLRKGKRKSVNNCMKYIKKQIGIDIKLKIKSMDEILDLSKYDKPDIIKLQDNRVYSECKSLPKQTLDKYDVSFKRNYVSEDLDKPETYITKVKSNLVLKSDTGTGKTTAFSQFIRDSKSKFISIGSRISLCDAQTNSFNRFKLDTVQYNQHLGTFTNDDNIVIMLDSIRRLKDSNIDYSQFVIYLDECSFLIEYLLSSDTMNVTRMFIFRELINVLKSCKQVIATDADINDICLTFLNDIGIEYEYHNNEYLNCKDVIASEIETRSSLIEIIKKTDKYLICCDSKTVAQGLSKELNDKNIIVFDSDYKGVINIEKHDKVIISPKVITGVDSTMPRDVFCVYLERTIDPKHMCQQINRCRSINKLYYHFPKKMIKAPVYNSLKDVYDEIDTADDVFMFKQFATDDEYSLFRKLYGKMIYDRDCSNTNKFLHFKNILKTRGFKDDNKYFVNPKEKMESRKELIKAKIDAINLDDLKWTEKNGKMIKPVLHNDNLQYLCIPDDQIEIYKEYIFDQIKLDEHYRICQFLFTTNQEQVLNNIAEFNIKKLTSTKGKVFVLRKICDAYGIDIKKDTVFNVTGKTDDIKVNTEMVRLYTSAFRYRGKPIDFSEPHSILKRIAMSLKTMFGTKIIKSKAYGKKKVIKYTLNNDFYESHLKLYKFRHPEFEDLENNNLINDLKTKLFK